MNITYTNEISLSDYSALRSSAGWPAICPEQAQAGLRGSKFLIAARDGETTVGLARVVSDGGFIAYLADVLVLPEYQRRGVGTEMMNRLMAQVKAELKEGFLVHFVLVSAQSKEEFYEQFGFSKCPGAYCGYGMAQWLHGTNNLLGGNI